ncbi:MAG: hypothetical protein E1N59_1761 [Puniceicoccaceae bacterium 5H]|nr:MAG: hypothetical protein E1N59_1761 [Puniceicoccaceae bacterium 5H]
MTASHSPNPPASTHWWTHLSTWLCLFGAGFVYAVALKYFVLPAKVILTGMEGIAVSLSYYFESEWLFIGLYLIFQTILLAFGFFKVGRSFSFRSLCVVTTVVVLLAVLPHFQFASPEATNERIILVLFGGILAGVAKAIAFRCGGSTADEDVLAAYFAIKHRKPVGSIAIVAGAASTIFGMAMALLKTGAFESVINTLMYTSIYIFVSAETLNNFYRKFRLSLVNIITQKADEVGDALKQQLQHRTFTIKEGRGGYSEQRFAVLQAVITHEEIALAVATIEAADPTCFYYYHDVEGVSANYYIRPIA